MGIHREGYRTIFLVLLLLGLVNIVLVPRHHGWFLSGFHIASALFFILILLFFRKPVRKAEILEDAIYAPADGSIVAIEEVFEDLYFKEKRIQVSIFMSPLNLHVNFCPISGIVEMVQHDPGSYIVAWHPKSSQENERTSTVIKQKNGNALLVRQIAGAVARRIVTYPGPGTEVTQGEELGFIKFGSRVDLFLPVDFDLQVALDQKVKGNITTLGFWQS